MAEGAALADRSRATSAEQPPSADAPRVLALLERYGWNATSFQVLEHGFEYWFAGDEACVAYVDTGRAWVAAGAPIAADDKLAQVASDFVGAAEQKSRRAAFFATERRFLEHTRFRSILIGEQPVWSPEDWVQSVRRSKSLREQLRRARAKGVRVFRLDPAEVSAPEAPLRAELEALIARWLGSRHMPPIGFLANVQPFLFADRRWLFVARRAERVLGLASVVPVYARQGWFIEDLIRAPDAPNGTVELLIDRAMREAAHTQAAYVTLGLAPLAGDVPPWLGFARQYSSPLYDFRGLWAFKAKFGPGEWAPIYLSYPREQNAFRAIYDSLCAFARGGLLSYGVRTFLRGPGIVVRGLALLLIPWTVLLASADPARWFPTAWIQRFWCVFDILLCVALWSLTLRWRPRLADLVLAVVIADTLLTAVQVLSWNLERVRSLGELGVVLVAAAAPALASVVLWNARRRVSRFVLRTSSI